KVLSCKVRASKATLLGLYSSNGKFKRLNLKSFTKFAGHTRGTLRNFSAGKLRKRFKTYRNLCAAQLLGESFTENLETADSCANTKPKLDPNATPTPSPTAMPTPTPTVTPTSTVISNLKLSDSNYDFGTVGVGETRYHSVVVKPEEGSPYILSATASNATGISLLSNAEVLERGGVPCAEGLARFCVVILRLAADSIGSKHLEVTIAFTDNPAVESAPTRTVSLTVTGQVQTAPMTSTHEFRTVYLNALAQAAGQTQVQYLQSELARLAPPSYETQDPFLFDSYNPAGHSNWANNWTNSVLDFSGVAWDLHQAGTAITRCHIVFARHYPRSGSITFTRKDGTIFQSNVTASVSFEPGNNNVIYDVTVARLNPCLPADWTIYPLVDGADVPMTGFNLTSAPYINSHYNFADNIRRVSITMVNLIHSASMGIYGAFNNTIPPYMQVMALNGDSGHPSFLLINGELVLTSTFSQAGYGGHGPHYGAASHQQRLRDAISALP
ncbi:MAG: hypothetical protein DCC75_07925, partial [Proteobacteria bacterium]